MIVCRMDTSKPRKTSVSSVGIAFEQLFAVIKRLRGPDGCPWDKEQTPTSMKENLVEETYECIEAIIDNNYDHIKEELGDLFLLVAMISYMFQQDNFFSIEDVLHTIKEKLIRRHPHVFTDLSVKNSEEVIQNWDNIKRYVEKKGEGGEFFDTIPKSFPPLDRAFKIQNKAGKVGFDWNSIDEVWKKLDEELNELKEMIASDNAERITEELGDVFFTLVNIARFLDTNPSTALHITNEKFKKRFGYVETEMKKVKKEMSSKHFDLMDQYWEESKKRSKYSE